ncbi:very-long-chain (3R)-3-hydroxyacyl-CoA dehydratase 4 isoform 1-T2 [Synchiropus picturatus]
MFRLAYIFSYNLLQFCGHTWILANTVARFLSFGRDALADMFYSVGLVTSLCQLMSFLELFHIADGIEKAKLLPRFIQVVERNLIMFTLVTLEEVQSKPAVCVLLFLWNILDLLRYPHELVCVMDKPSPAMLWARYTLWIPIYILSAASEGFTIYHVLLDLWAPESDSPPAIARSSSSSSSLQFLLILAACLTILTLGVSVTVRQLLQERQQQLDRPNKKKKK